MDSDADIDLQELESQLYSQVYHKTEENVPLVNAQSPIPETSSTLHKDMNRNRYYVEKPPENPPPSNINISVNLSGFQHVSEQPNTNFQFNFKQNEGAPSTNDNTQNLPPTTNTLFFVPPIPRKLKGQKLKQHREQRQQVLKAASENAELFRLLNKVDRKKVKKYEKQQRRLEMRKLKKKLEKEGNLIDKYNKQIKGTTSKTSINFTNRTPSVNFTNDDKVVNSEVTQNVSDEISIVNDDCDLLIISDDDDEVIIIEPDELQKAEIISLESEPINKSLDDSQLMKPPSDPEINKNTLTRNELLNTPESTNDFLDEMVLPKETEFKASHPTAISEIGSESSCSTDISTPIKSTIFNEPEFETPKELFSETNLEKFGEFITPKRKTTSPGPENEGTIKASKKVNKSEESDESNSSSSESDYQTTSNLPNLSYFEDTQNIDSSTPINKRKNLIKTPEDLQSKRKKKNKSFEERLDDLVNKLIQSKDQPVNSSNELNKRRKNKNKVETVKKNKKNKKKTKEVKEEWEVHEDDNSKLSKGVVIIENCDEDFEVESNKSSEDDIQIIDEESSSDNLSDMENIGKDMYLANIKRDKHPTQTKTTEKKRFIDTWSEDMDTWHDNNFKEKLSSVKEIQETMTDDPNKWKILDCDKYFISQKTPKGPKCRRCNRTGHMAFNCTEKVGPQKCSLCGNAGHLEPRCPNKICTACGRKSSFTTTYCSKCAEMRKEICSICKMTGHSNKYCPDVWRRYHLTTEEGPIVECGNKKTKHASDLKPHQKRWCSGCAKRGHLEYKCRNFNRTHPPVVPYIMEYKDVYGFAKNRKKKFSEESDENLDTRKLPPENTASKEVQDGSKSDDDQVKITKLKEKENNVEEANEPKEHVKRKRDKKKNLDESLQEMAPKELKPDENSIDDEELIVSKKKKKKQKNQLELHDDVESPKKEKKKSYHSADESSPSKPSKKKKSSISFEDTCHDVEGASVQEEPSPVKTKSGKKKKNKSSDETNELLDNIEEKSIKKSGKKKNKSTEILENEEYQQKLVENEDLNEGKSRKRRKSQGGNEEEASDMTDTTLKVSKKSKSKKIDELQNSLQEIINDTVPGNVEEVFDMTDTTLKVSKKSKSKKIDESQNSLQEIINDTVPGNVEEVFDMTDTTLKVSKKSKSKKIDESQNSLQEIINDTVPGNVEEVFDMTDTTLKVSKKSKSKKIDESQNSLQEINDTIPGNVEEVSDMTDTTLKVSKKSKSKKIDELQNSLQETNDTIPGNEDGVSDMTDTTLKVSKKSKSKKIDESQTSLKETNIPDTIPAEIDIVINEAQPSHSNEIEYSDFATLSVFLDDEDVKDVKPIPTEIATENILIKSNSNELQLETNESNNEINQESGNNIELPPVEIKNEISQSMEKSITEENIVSNENQGGNETNDKIVESSEKEISSEPIINIKVEPQDSNTTSDGRCELSIAVKQEVIHSQESNITELAEESTEITDNVSIPDIKPIQLQPSNELNTNTNSEIIEICIKQDLYENNPEPNIVQTTITNESSDNPVRTIITTDGLENNPMSCESLNIPDQMPDDNNSQVSNEEEIVDNTERRVENNMYNQNYQTNTHYVVSTTDETGLNNSLDQSSRLPEIFTKTVVDKLLKELEESSDSYRLYLSVDAHCKSENGSEICKTFLRHLNVKFVFSLCSYYIEGTGAEIVNKIHRITNFLNVKSNISVHFHELIAKIQCNLRLMRATNFNDYLQYYESWVATKHFRFKQKLNIIFLVYCGLEQGLTHLQNLKNILINNDKPKCYFSIYTIQSVKIAIDYIMNSNFPFDFYKKATADLQSGKISINREILKDVFHRSIKWNLNPGIRSGREVEIEDANEFLVPDINVTITNQTITTPTNAIETLPENNLLKNNLTVFMEYLQTCQHRLKIYISLSREDFEKFVNKKYDGHRILRQVKGQKDQGHFMLEFSDRGQSLYPKINHIGVYLKKRYLQLHFDENLAKLMYRLRKIHHFLPVSPIILFAEYLYNGERENFRTKLNMCLFGYYGLEDGAKHINNLIEIFKTYNNPRSICISSSVKERIEESLDYIFYVPRKTEKYFELIDSLQDKNLKPLSLLNELFFEDLMHKDKLTTKSLETIKYNVPVEQSKKLFESPIINELLKELRENILIDIKSLPEFQNGYYTVVMTGLENYVTSGYMKLLKILNNRDTIDSYTKPIDIFKFLVESLTNLNILYYTVDCKKLYEEIICLEQINMEYNKQISESFKQLNSILFGKYELHDGKRHMATLIYFKEKLKSAVEGDIMTASSFLEIKIAYHFIFDSARKPNFDYLLALQVIDKEKRQIIKDIDPSFKDNVQNQIMHYKSKCTENRQADKLKELEVFENYFVNTRFNGEVYDSAVRFLNDIDKYLLDYKNL